jgi:chaperonin cofactor prefoldin
MCNEVLFHFLLQDIEFVQAKIDDLEKQMKRSNDKQLKIEHELCQRVGHVYSSVALH